MSRAAGLRVRSRLPLATASHSAASEPRARRKAFPRRCADIPRGSTVAPDSRTGLAGAHPQTPARPVSPGRGGSASGRVTSGRVGAGRVGSDRIARCRFGGRGCPVRVGDDCLQAGPLGCRRPRSAAVRRFSRSPSAARSGSRRGDGPAASHPWGGCAPPRRGRPVAVRTPRRRPGRPARSRSRRPVPERTAGGALRSATTTGRGVRAGPVSDGPGAAPPPRRRPVRASPRVRGRAGLGSGSRRCAACPHGGGRSQARDGTPDRAPRPAERGAGRAGAARPAWACGPSPTAVG